IRIHEHDGPRAILQRVRALPEPVDADGALRDDEISERMHGGFLLGLMLLPEAANPSPLAAVRHEDRHPRFLLCLLHPRNSVRERGLLAPHEPRTQHLRRAAHALLAVDEEARW